MKKTFLIILNLFLLFSLSAKIQADVDVNKLAADYLFEKTGDFIFWNRIHALEFLDQNGYKVQAKEILEKSLTGFDSVPQKRIGFWRCCAETSFSLAEKKSYINKILGAYLNPGSPDKIHAVESLAKLKYSLRTYPKQSLENDSLSNILQGYVLWARAIPPTFSDTLDYSSIFSVLESDNTVQRDIMAYGLNYMGIFENGQWEKLANLALTTSLESPIAVRLLHGAISTCPDIKSYDSQIEQIRTFLLETIHIPDNEMQYESCMALGELRDKRDLDLLKEIFLSGGVQFYIKGKTYLHQLKDLKLVAAYSILQLSQAKKKVRY